MKYISKSTLSFASTVSTKAKSLFWLHAHIKAYRRFFYLVAEPVWYVGILVLNYIAIIVVTYASLNSKCLDNEEYHKYKLNEIIYTLDVIYVIDIVMVIGCKLMPRFDLNEVDLVLRPFWIIILEIVSLIPFEFCVPTNSSAGRRTFCIVKLTKVLRFVRILYFYVRHRNLIGSKIFVRIVAMLSMEILMIMLTYSIYCNVSCISGICEDRSCRSIEAIILLTSVFTSSGLLTVQLNFTWAFLSVIGLMINHYLIYALTTCEIAYEFFHKCVREVYFVINYNNVLFKEKMWMSPKFLREATHTYFFSVWKNREGYYENRFSQEDIPNSFKNEKNLDVAWAVFQHSHLLKKQSLPFLREISKYLKAEYKLPGEFIWRRDQWKNKLIYIASGTIQLLSEEDGESPVLSLTSGTCIGDSCMVMPYPSRNNVRCKGFCEIYTLATSDFVRLCSKFPRESILAKVAINWRRNQAKQIKNIVNIDQKIDSNSRSLDIYNLLWVKNTLHKHMSVNTEALRRHRFQNIYLLNETNPKDFKRMIFTAYFLDSLAIAERLEIDTDTVFLRHSCPCILQPDSVIVYFWEFFIILMTVIVAFLVPRKAFLPNIDMGWLSLVISICTIIFCIDIYVQFSIGITSRDGTKGTFTAIAKEKMGTFGFWADIFSCFPFEILKCIIYTKLSTTRSSVLYMNRLIKLWRIENILRKWEKRFNVNFKLIEFIRYCLFMGYLIYFCYCILHIIITVNANQNELGFIAIQLVTMTGISLGIEPNTMFFLLTNVIFRVVIILKYANFISADALDTLKEAHVQDYCGTVYELLKNRPRLAYKMKVYLSAQWQDNRCENVLKTIGINYDLPQYLRSDIFLYASKDRISNLKIFAMLPQDIVHEMCSTILKYIIYPPNESLSKTGDITRMVTLVYSGTTQMIDSSGISYELDSRPYVINFVEAALRMQSGVTIMTTTHVKVFYFDIEDYEAVLSRHHDKWTDYKNIIDNSSDLKVQCRTICEGERDIGVILKEPSKPGKSYYRFLHSLKDSYAEYDYFVPFDKLYPFHFLRYFLMRTIFLPDGNFLFYWECLRCFFAVTSCIIYFSYPFAAKYRSLASLLDITCLADLYVRLHVAYYDENGILVYHPVKTAKYYITHSFIIDVLGSLPLGYFSSTDAFGYFTLTVPRLFQMYRYIKFVQHLQKDPTKLKSKFQGILHIPVCLVIVNLFGTLLVTVNCVQEIGALMCLEAIMVASSNINWFNDIFIHFSGIYVATTSFVNFGLGVFQIKWTFNFVCISLLCIIGLHYKTIIIAHLLTMYSFPQRNLIVYQENISSLKFFLNTINVHNFLRTAILDAYELKWNYTKGRDFRDVCGTVVGTIRTDLIYSYYGEQLYRNCVFTFRRRSFYRNLLVDAKYECYPQGGYIITINDIINNVYIPYSGAVDVIGADGAVLKRLVPTSFFGNLEYTEFMRMKISAVAATSTEVLCVGSKLFHDLLEQYPNIKNEFEDLRIVYGSYIPSSGESYSEMNIKETKEPIMTTQSKYKWFWLIPIYKKLKSWRLFVQFYCSYIAIILDLYQFGSMEYSYTILVLQYVADILYFIQLLRNKAFVVGKGLVAATIKGKMKNKFAEIKLIFRQKNVRLLLAISSLIAIDLPILFFMKHTQHKYHLFSLFRANRSLRLLDMLDYFRELNNKFNINLTLVRFGYIVFWLSLVWVTMTSVFALVTCYTPYSILPPFPTCSIMLRLEPWKRFKLYMKYLSLSCHFLTFTGQHSYTPQSIPLLIVFIFSKLLCLYLFAVIFSQVFSIVKDCNSYRIYYRDFGNRLKTFLRLEDVSSALIDRTMRYIELLWLRSKGRNYPVFMKIAPSYLQDAILYDSYYQLIGMHPLFAHCHRDCVRQIIQKTRTDIYFNHDYIQFRGVVEPTMFFIYRGSVKVIDETTTQDVTVKTLSTGQSFGIIEGLFNKKLHEFTYQAHGSAIIVSLNLKKWVYLLDHFPASKVRIYSVAEGYIGDERLPSGDT